ncbi:hypothetical protein CYLTODRAFT_341990 [Cylindrobasidium torrendii FP15055 ss-10]|uniref:Uncharacterized protein n=1 Tax=Cylindrobasidium torrendii FP15055 ss-10 TaxID=1314674 RepID=A0A0D7BVF5_9AGAR|nr:hypothetical protein CYLTODRAFT_341990 [Cylindrobasidium torrendii FP15055 ss-10]
MNIDSDLTEQQTLANWHSALKLFLQDLGLSQALRGLELDILVMNPDFEQERVPGAIGKLLANLKVRCTNHDLRSFPPLEERKLQHVKPPGSSAPVHPTTVTKSISKFLAQTRARNDASNRSEFLQSLQEKRAATGSMDVDSCARTDAKHVDRHEQIKYDVVKNDASLRRTMKKSADPAPESRKGKERALDEDWHKPYTEFDQRVNAEKHPGLNARLLDVEAHFGVHYVPSPPISLLARLKLLEDHIIRLEKDYPPWAALHFNQPHRDWPPPPPSQPLIVPHDMPKLDSRQPVTTVQLPEHTKNSKSSLARAVMDRLQVQKAMRELEGAKRDG